MKNTKLNWKEKLIEDVKKYRNLGCNWDDNGAYPFSKEVCDIAIKVINLLDEKDECKLGLGTVGEYFIYCTLGDITISIECNEFNYKIYTSSSNGLEDKLVKTYSLDSIMRLMVDFMKYKKLAKERMESFNKILDFTKLPENWNNNSAGPISKETYDVAYRFLKYCMYNMEVFPTATDSIQFEMEIGDRYLEVECHKEGYDLFIKEKERVIEGHFEIDELHRILNEVKIFVTGRPQKSVLFSGAFNPPTIAHQFMITSAVKNGGFDYVIFAISNQRFLDKKMKKTGDFGYSEKDRLNMILEMTWMEPNVLIYGVERGYTYDVLKDTQAIFNIPELYFAFGSDKLQEVERWGHHNELLREFCFYVLKRTESDEYIKTESERIFANTKYILGTDDKRFQHINATQVRALIKKEQYFGDLVPATVHEYILKNLI